MLAVPWSKSTTSFLQSSKRTPISAAQSSSLTQQDFQPSANQTRCGARSKPTREPSGTMSSPSNAVTDSVFSHMTTRQRRSKKKLMQLQKCIMEFQLISIHANLMASFKQSQILTNSQHHIDAAVCYKKILKKFQPSVLQPLNGVSIKKMEDQLGKSQKKFVNHPLEKNFITLCLSEKILIDILFKT